MSEFMDAGESVIVVPVYGYGWRAGAEFIEIPNRFELDVKYKNSRSDGEILGGKCITPGHLFENMSVLLIHRNFSIYDTFLKSNDFDFKNIDTKIGVGAVDFEGFAEISP